MTDILAIDTVVNPLTPEIARSRPAWSAEFLARTFKREGRGSEGYSYAELLTMRDAARVERAFLVAAKIGQLGLPGSWHLPYETVAEAVKLHPDRFYGLAGLDPTEGMAGVRNLQRAVEELGFIGAHLYPHWFE